MAHSFASLFDRYVRTVSRRDLFRAGSLLTIPAWRRSAIRQARADRLHHLVQLHVVLAGGVLKETKPPGADIGGEWDVHIDFAGGSSTHTLFLRQEANRIEGTHRGDYVARDLFGSISGDAVRMTSRYTEQHGDALTFTFSGTVNGDSMAGDLDMDEYLKAKWSATRHQFRRGAGA